MEVTETIYTVTTASKGCFTIEGLRERTEYVPQLWNWESHL